MSYNGSGVFSINTSGQPVVANTLIQAVVFNALTADLATGLSNVICRDGQSTITANIPMATFKLTGLGAGSAAGHSVRYEQLQWFLLSTGTASSSATLDFTGLTGYSAYVFELEMVRPATDNVSLLITVSTDNGSNWKAASYAFANSDLNAAATAGTTVSTSATAIIIATGVDNGSTDGISGTVKLAGASSTAKHKHLISQTAYIDNSGNAANTFGSGGYFGGVDDIDAVRFAFTSGNVADGVIRCYGIKGA